jgi:MinD-like ATPase involved in chromosome partitioning or flagellar assembly
MKKFKLTFWSLAAEFRDESTINEFLLNDFKLLLEKLKLHYDCIVIDCAPCFVSSMLLVYELADVHVLCFAEGVSTNSDIIQVTEIVAPACKENAKIYSAMTMTKLKANTISARGSDGFYYQMNRAA